MSSLNKIVLLGTVESELDFKESTDGESIVRFNLHVNRPERSDGIPSGSDVMPIIGRRSTAEKCKVIKKGQQIMAEGRITTGRTTQEDGSFKYFTEVELLSVSSLSVQNADSSVNASPSHEKPTSPPIMESKDNIPTFSFDSSPSNNEVDLEETVPF